MIHSHNVAKPCHHTMSSTMAEDESISFINILVRTEVSVESHMKVKVILRVIGGIILQRLPLAAATNATQTLSKMIKRQVLPASLHKKFLRQHHSSQERWEIEIAVGGEIVGPSKWSEVKMTKQ